MFNQWWSYNFNEEGNISNMRPRVFHFPSRKIQRKVHMISHWYTQRNEYKFLEKPTLSSLHANRDTLTKWVFHNVYATSTKHIPTRRIFSWSESSDTSETERESDVPFISARKPSLEGCTFWKIDKVFHSSCLWRKLTPRQPKSSAFSMAVSFQLHHDLLYSFFIMIYIAGESLRPSNWHFAL